MLDERALREYRCGVNIVDPLHRMRIAHGHDRHLGRAAVHEIELPGFPLDLGLRHPSGVRRIERNTRQLEHRGPHVDPHVAIDELVQFDDATVNFDAHRGFIGQALLANKTHKATGTIAAVFNLGAVGIVDRVFEIDVRLRRFAHAQNLVGTNAKVPIRQPTVLGRGEPQSAAGFVQHDEVVASTLHLGETDVHEAALSGHSGRLSPTGVPDMDSPWVTEV